MSLLALWEAGFNVASLNHAEAILVHDFNDPLNDLIEILLALQISDSEFVKGGGGEASVTRRLRLAITEIGWRKRRIVIRKIVDDQEQSATTHEIDHVCATEQGKLALEIEWNNKDPFFDRDLENFQRLHAEGAISVGFIITRGNTLQEALRAIVADYARDRKVQDFDDLKELDVEPTPRQRNKVLAEGGEMAEDWAKVFVSEKYGGSTTHWGKLQERIQRGVGNPCPLVLIGIPSNVVIKTTDFDAI